MALKDLRNKRSEGNHNEETTTKEGQSDKSLVKETETHEHNTISEKDEDTTEVETSEAEANLSELVFKSSVLENITEETVSECNALIEQEAVSIDCELEEASTFKIAIENAKVVEVQEVIVAATRIKPVSSVPVYLEDESGTDVDYVSKEGNSFNDSNTEISENNNDTDVGKESEQQEDIIATVRNNSDNTETHGQQAEEEIIYPENKVRVTECSPLLDTPSDTDNTDASVDLEDQESLNKSDNTETNKHPVEQEIIHPDNNVRVIECSPQLQTPSDTENTEVSVKVEDQESFNSHANQDISYGLNGLPEDTPDGEVKETLAPAKDTEDKQEPRSVEKVDSEQDIEEDSKTFVEKLKILKGNLLARHIIREDSYSVIGSVDFDESADIEFDRLHAEPIGKTIDEELRETVKHINDSESATVKEEVPFFNSSCVSEIEPQDSDTGNISDEGIMTEVTDKELNFANTDKLKMPETRDETDGCASPTMMFASCRYRWEKTIMTESDSVVFVTINNKDIEPLKLEWQPASTCYYSGESKIPVGTYVGHLVVDGAFYPVEDITVKHYTFEVDLFLKDDIIEDESQKSGVTKAEDFVRHQKDANGLEVVPNQDRTTDTRYSPVRATSYTYSASRARMEPDQETTNQAQGDSSIHVTSKYEDLVRSQLNHTKSSILDTDYDVDINHSIKSDYSDLDGRRSPVGDDGVKQYQDGDETDLKTADLGYGYRSTDDTGAERERYNKSLVEDDVERQSVRSGGSRASHSGHASPAVIDDVLGNGHARSPVYSTESPIHSRHSSAHSSAHNSTHNSAHNSAHSSARATPTAAAPSPTRPESVGSNRSANSVSRHMLDDIIKDTVRSDPRSPNGDVSDDVRSGSGAVTPPPSEQIGDVLNPSDRHSPIRRDYFTNSPQLSHHSSQASIHSSPHGSAHGSAHGSPYGSTHSSVHGSAHSSVHGSAHNSVHGSAHSSVQGSTHGSPYNSAHSSQRQTPQRDLISDSLKNSQERLYVNDEKRSFSGSQHSGSQPGSRAHSVTSEQELSQYYENDTEVRRTPVTGMSPGSRTGSAASLPVIGSQRQTPDKRSMTPDNHIRVPVVGPIMKGPLLPGRVTPKTPVSNASSRTITPVNTPVNTPSEAIEQIRELETTVSNLRVMSAAKDQEMVTLKGQLEEVKVMNRQLQGDLDRQRARASPGQQLAELERKHRDAVEERERLSSEVVRLREELRTRDEPGLNRYNPNSPTALQRKIDELNSQIQDLHEVNESAVEDRSGLERKLSELERENEVLRSTQSARQQDIEEENRQLKSENKALKESQSGYSDVTDYRYKIELQQVKEDNRSLRDRNYALHDDNVRLREELAELRKSVEVISSGVRRQYNDDVTGANKSERYEKHDDKDKLLETYNSDLGHHDYKTSDLNRPASDDRHKYSYKRSSRYDVKQEPPKVEKEYETERFSKSDSFRYESYRAAGDGISYEKPSRPSAKYDPRPLTPERPSALAPSRKDYNLSETLDKKYDLFDRKEADRNRRERNRTSSADLDFRSMPLSVYSDLSKTTPALSGRSREIYQQLSDKRAAHKAKVKENDQPQLFESEESKPEPETQTQTQTNSNSHTSNVFVNRYIPQTKESECEEKPKSDEIKRLSAERLEYSYAKSTPSLLTARSKMEKEEKVYDPRPAEAFLDDGDMSDTPTDILVNTQPLDRIPSSNWAHRGRNRRGSVGSDASNSSFSDIDEQIAASVRKRSKSADGREILRRTMQSNTLRAERASSAKGEKTLSRTLSPAPPSGHRSVTPRPLATQHNKSSLFLSSSIGSLTHGLRPFAPRSPGDLQIGDVIKFSRQGGKLSQGTIRFIGHLPGRGDIYLGVELDKEDGKHDGIFEDIRYFRCKPNKGVFVAYNKVVMAWTV